MVKAFSSRHNILIIVHLCKLILKGFRDEREIRRSQEKRWNNRGTFIKYLKKLHQPFEPHIHTFIPV